MRNNLKRNRKKPLKLQKRENKDIKIFKSVCKLWDNVLEKIDNLLGFK
jgi:hypothetical protein